MVLRLFHRRRLHRPTDAATRHGLARQWRCAPTPLLAVLLIGCTVGPDYKPPETTVATTFGKETGEPQPPATRPSSVTTVQPVRVAQWWTLFHDPTLNALIDEAIVSNLDLKLAEARVREARGLRSVVTGQQYP